MYKTMRIEYEETLDSTQEELRRRLIKDMKAPLCIVAKHQTNGRGSRGNVWENEIEALMFSFAYNKPLCLPDDIPPQSIAIFLGFVIKEYLAMSGSKVWLKYPNDLYIAKQKVGGILVEKWRDVLLCGVGINLISTKFGALDIVLDKSVFLKDIFKVLQNPPSWKQTFRKYKLEFHKNSSFSFHLGTECISLENALLLEDGGLDVDGRIIYNLRSYGA